MYWIAAVAPAASYPVAAPLDRVLMARATRKESL
jgi:hypothetical protein